MTRRSHRQVPRNWEWNIPANCPPWCGEWLREYYQANAHHALRVRQLICCGCVSCNMGQKAQNSLKGVHCGGQNSLGDWYLVSRSRVQGIFAQSSILKAEIQSASAVASSTARSVVWFFSFSAQQNKQGLRAYDIHVGNEAIFVRFDHILFVRWAGWGWMNWPVRLPAVCCKHQVTLGIGASGHAHTHNLHPTFSENDIFFYYKAISIIHSKVIIWKDAAK